MQQAFVKSAQSANGVGASPREWIEAQFAKFEEFSAFLNRKIIPQPQQLYGLTAQARFLDWKRETIAEKSRDYHGHQSFGAKFKTDKRKLKSLARVLRMPESDVLVEKPEEFSREFLKHRGVLTLVEERLEEMAS